MRDFAREAAQLENSGGREAAAERLVEQQVEVVALDKDRVVVEFYNKGRSHDTIRRNPNRDAP